MAQSTPRTITNATSKPIDFAAKKKKKNVYDPLYGGRKMGLIRAYVRRVIPPVYLPTKGCTQMCNDTTTVLLHLPALWTNGSRQTCTNSRTVNSRRLNASAFTSKTKAGRGVRVQHTVNAMWKTHRKIIPQRQPIFPIVPPATPARGNLPLCHPSPRQTFRYFHSMTNKPKVWSSRVGPLTWPYSCCWGWV